MVKPPLFFNAVGDQNALNGDINKTSFPPGFDANGKVRICNSLTCITPGACPQPRADATCQPNGAWVIPGNVDAESLSVACPLRIQGNLNVLRTITVGGCGMLTVDGTASFTSTRGTTRINPDSFVTATFDMNDYGKPTSADDRINWLTSGNLVGGIASWSARNIWDDALTITNQRCGNSFSVLFFRNGGTEPPSTCPTATANAVTESEDEFSAALADQLEQFSADADITAAIGEAQDDTFFADVAQADDINAAFAEAQDDTFVADVAQADDINAAFAEAQDDTFVDEPLIDAAFGDTEFAVGDTQNTNTPTTSSSSAPAYAYGLFVIGVLVLVALVVIQVQIVLLRRARESARL